MGDLHLTAFDLAAIGIVLISSIMAFARGLLREVFSIVALAGAAIAALWGHNLLAPYLQGLVGTPLLAHIAAAGILAIAAFIIITVATSTLAKALHKSGEIGAIDRAAGLAFGAARGVLVLALFVLLMRHITGAPQAPMPDWLSKARTYPVLSQVADSVSILGPKVESAIQRRRAEAAAKAAGSSAAPASGAPAP